MLPSTPDASMGRNIFVAWPLAMVPRVSRYRMAMRSGVDVRNVIKQLRGIRCPSIAWEGGKSVLSCADAIASVLERFVEGETEAVEKEEIPEGKVIEKTEDFGLVRNIAGQCPDCGGLLAYQEGCFVCPACGYTKC